jgi:hypothetical protein
MINGTFIQGFAFGRRPRKAIAIRPSILSWRMDETSNLVSDYSGNGHTGRVDGTPSRNATVYGENKGIQLTASGHGVSIDKNICPLVVAALESQTCTISMVFENSTSGVANPCPFVIWNNASGGSTTLRLGNDKPGYANWSSFTGVQNYGSIQDATVTGLKIITYVRTPSEGRLYADGVLVATKVHSPAVVPAVSSFDRIQVGGHLNFPASYQYAGRASDLNIWNVALTASEVATLASLQGRTPDQRTNIDPYAANVVSLLHFDGSDGSQGFFDISGKTWSYAGFAQLDTAQSRFGGSSLWLQSGRLGTRAQTPHSTDFDFGAGVDYTLECFFRSSSAQVGSAIITTAKSGSGAVHFALGFCDGTVGSTGGNRLFFGFYTGSAWVGCVNPTELTNNQWYHIAATRSGTRYSLWVDGVEVAFIVSATANPTASQPVYIGNRWESTFRSVNGWIDEVRVTKGVARYTSNFTPPTAAFPNP